MRFIQPFAAAMLCSAISVSAHADIRHYGANLANANWQVTSATPLACELVHDIPRFGQVSFQSEASKHNNLIMLMEFKQLPNDYGMATVKSVAPSWWPGQNSYELSSMPLYKQFPGQLEQQQAWTLLSELEKGRQPTFFFQDWYNPRDQIAVGLAAAKFRPRYDEFLDCVANLLPFSFDDISFTVLNFNDSDGELTLEAQRKLNQIGQYLAHDNQLELVLVDAYTDAYGAREPNQTLTEARAEAVKRFFTERGIAADRITTVGHGERRHVDGNDDALSRAQNRRVVVQLSKPHFAAGFRMTTATSSEAAATNAEAE